MILEPMTRECLRIVRHFKEKLRVRHRAPKRHAAPSEPSASGAKNAKEP